MPYFKHCEAELYYEENGNGFPLIFLHALSWDMRLWKRQVDCFAPKYRVITLDTRGHGKSTLPAGAIDPEVFWQDVVAMMNHLDIPKAVLCGLSMGGHITIQTAINAKSRVEGIILIGALCTSKLNLLERFCLPIGNFMMRPMPMSLIAWGLALVAGRHNNETKAYILDAVGSCDHSVFIRSLSALSKMDSREGLPQIVCPSLILIGDHDIIVRRQQNYMHRHIPGSHLITIKNAHHGTNLDNPQLVEKEIESFMQEITAR